MEVKPFLVSYKAFWIPGYGLQNLLRPDCLEEDINVTELGLIVNVIPIQEPLDLEEVSSTQEHGFEFTPDGGNGLIYVHIPY